MIKIYKELSGSKYLHPIGGKEIFNKGYLESLSIEIYYGTSWPLQFHIY